MRGVLLEVCKRVIRNHPEEGAANCFTRNVSSNFGAGGALKRSPCAGQENLL